MIEFISDLPYTTFLWGTVIMGTIFIINVFTDVIPHSCWFMNESDHADMGAIFCIRCLEKFFTTRIDRPTRSFIGMLFLSASPVYILKVLIKVHYTDEFNVGDLVIVCLLCTVAHFANYDLYASPMIDTTLPVLSGCAFFIVFSIYFRLTVNFVLMSMILCLFNMVICGLQRCLYWRFLCGERIVADLLIRDRPMDEGEDDDHGSGEEDDHDSEEED